MYYCLSLASKYSYLSLEYIILCKKSWEKNILEKGMKFYCAETDGKYTWIPLLRCIPTCNLLVYPLFAME